MPVNALTKYLKLVLFIRANKLYEWSYDNALAFDEACKMLDEIIKWRPNITRLPKMTVKSAKNSWNTSTREIGNFIKVKVES